MKRRLLIGSFAVALLLVGLDFAAVRIGVAALITSPNRGRVVAELVEPPPPPDVTPLRFAVPSPPASIAAWLLDCQQPVATVFVLHGIRDSKAPQLETGRRLAAAHFRTVLVDLRGHGASTGDVLSYGVFDSRDLSAIVDQMSARGQLAGKVGALGFSYGAATAIEWAGRDSRVAAVVAVAPFSSLRAIMPHYAEMMVPGLGALIPEFAFDRTLRAAGEAGHFDAALASPLDAIAGAKAHILLIHGKSDHHIASHSSELLHERAPDRTELILLDGEDHVSIMGDRQHVIAGRGLDWLKRYTE